MIHAGKKILKGMARAAGVEIRRLPREESANEATYSAFDEQILIGQYIKQLECKQKFCVDIGAGDGITGSNSYALFRAGWAGLAVECDAEKFAALAARHKAFSAAQLSNCRVTPENVVSLLHAHCAPREFGFLSLDIDGYDYFVLERVLESFRPSLLCAEINEKIPPPIRFTVKWDPDYRWATDHFYGQSISQLAMLCTRFQYALAGVHLNNAFLIPQEISPVPALTPEEAYRKGYVERPDRKEKLPWNSDMEELLTLPPEEGLAFLRKRFASYEGKYICEL